MSNVVVFTGLTLDGVMQAPGRPDEDHRGGFQHGGLAQPYNDPVMGKVAGEGYAYWPKQTNNPFTERSTTP
jgi:hypothetical protein